MQWDGDRPEQNQLVSTKQSDEQPSPPVLLPSSHCSALELTAASPQTGSLRHKFAWGHFQPASTAHAGLQPSPAALLWSSQSSPLSQIPLPQTAPGMTK